MPENAFSLEDIFLSSFQILKIYLRALVRRLDTPRWHPRLSQVSFCLKDGVVAVNQTKSQENKVFRNKKCYYTYKRLAMKYGHLRAQLA